MVENRYIFSYKVFYRQRFEHCTNSLKNTFTANEGGITWKRFKSLKPANIRKQRFRIETKKTKRKMEQIRVCESFDEGMFNNNGNNRE